jgi:hypothetical protein
MASERVKFRASQDGSFVDVAFNPLLCLPHVLHRQWQLLALGGGLSHPYHVTSERESAFMITYSILFVLRVILAKDVRTSAV